GREEARRERPAYACRGAAEAVARAGNPEPPAAGTDHHPAGAPGRIPAQRPGTPLRHRLPDRVFHLPGTDAAVGGTALSSTGYQLVNCLPRFRCTGRIFPGTRISTTPTNRSWSARLRRASDPFRSIRPIPATPAWTRPSCR